MSEVESDVGRARTGPGPVERFARGFSAPAVLLALAAGGLTGWLTREPAGAAVSPPRPTVPAPEGEVPATDEPAEEEAPPGPEGRATRAEVQELIRRGELRRARTAAEAAGYEDLGERAALLLALTENVVLGPWGQAETGLRCALRDGKVVLGAALSDEGEALELETWDGERLVLAKGDVTERKGLRGGEKTRALAEALAQARAALGAEPSGLSVHRLAFFALRGGDRESGVRLLIEALTSREGRILVDMHGSGDFPRLHRAREALAGEPGSQPPPPRPTPTPTPAPVPVEPEEEPPPEPARPSADPLMRDPDWQRVEALYRQGIGLYREAFGASIREGAAEVKQALARFQQAQELLERLIDRHPGDEQIERRMIEINSLVIDCHKRLGTD